jgi:cytochrome c-type biogenesis protein CcmH
MLWVVFAALTAVALASVLWPLIRAPRGVDQREGALAFYKAQTAEIDRDVARGLLAESDATAARAEAARRLIGSSEDKPQRAPRRNAWVIGAFCAVFVPAVALGLYGSVGSPDYADQPLQARLNAAPNQMDLMTAVARIERHLAEHPDDARGWEVIAPVYMRVGRAAEAARAWSKAIQYGGPSAEKYESLGESLAYAASGQINEEARKAFEAALASAPEMPQPQFFLGLAAEQRGDLDKARAIWTQLIEKSPNLSWAGMVREKLAGLSSKGGPDSAPGQAIAALPQQEQQAAIRSMVDGLASRLAQNGNDIEGWLKLARAYTVLQEKDRAQQALTNARKAFSQDAAAQARIDALAHELGLGG